MLARTKLQVASRNRWIAGALLAASILFFLSSVSSLSRIHNPAVHSEPEEERRSSPKSESDSFLYFGYASDLLESRLKAGGGPSAKLLGIGRVKGHSFAFSQESKVWRGGVADIVPSERGEVWGAVYRLKASDATSLNKQKGADKADPLYEKITVMVEMDGKTVEAITYSIVDSKRLPFGTAPSPQYKECLLRGAEELGLPERYIESLRRIKDNGSTHRRKNVC